MMFVPVVSQPPREPSIQARELASRLAQAIQEYRGQRRDLSTDDVKQALRLVGSSLPGGSPAPMVLAVIVGALLFALALGLAMARSPGGFPGEGVSLVYVAIAVMALLGIVAAAVRRKP
ncbi:MAG: hypothetical protein OEZ37_03935 [Gemmatimonadota bacterium]|nr:hypothetical protein [Gemmatimonadota bacterium]